MGCRDWGFGFQDSELGAPDSGFKVKGVGLGI